MPPQLNRDWTEFLLALTCRRVRFLLVGGHALAVHAEPRLTRDIDVLVEPSRPNALRVHAALDDFGFGAVLPKPEAFAVKGKVFMLGREPMRIDILTSIAAVSFREAWRSRVPIEIAGQTVYVIGREALIKNKLAAGRPKDLADVAALQQASPRRRRSRK